MSPSHPPGTQAQAQPSGRGYTNSLSPSFCFSFLSRGHPTNVLSVHCCITESVDFECRQCGIHLKCTTPAGDSADFRPVFLHLAPGTSHVHLSDRAAVFVSVQKSHVRTTGVPNYLYRARTKYRHFFSPPHHFRTNLRALQRSSAVFILRARSVQVVEMFAFGNG